ncbi:MAG: apolipoprotein N-acyltransferase [Ruminococcus sp.]|nr:apolipoprotein N-acyltransferase [Ruminococcus sp.]
MDKNKLKIFLPLIASGLLTGALQVCFSVPLLAFISLIPLMSSVYKFKSSKDYYVKIISFLLPYYFVQTAFLLTVFELIDVPLILGMLISVLLVAAVTLWLTLLMFIPLCVYPFVRKGKNRDFLIFILLFVFGECIAEYVPFLSFPWSGLWLSVISEPLLTQPAALLGCRFVSFIILAENCLATAALYSKSRKTIIKNAAIFTLILLFNISYSITHISEIKKTCVNSETIKTMAAQDNVEGRDKENVNLTSAVDTYISIMENSWQADIKLAVLPETAVPTSYDEKSEDFQKLCNFAKEKNTTIFTGCFFSANQKKYNAMYSVTRDGFCKTPYLKQMLVPFGEKIPLASFWGRGTLTCGEKTDNHCLLTAEKIKTANVICIESIYPSLTRCQIKEGGEILCISTNDSWFGNSYARFAHFRHSIMRSVESGRYTIRAGNCGISAIISPWGEIIASEVRPIKTAITADVKLLKNKNLYTVMGDIIVLPGMIIFILFLFKWIGSKLMTLKFKLKKSC